MKAVSDAQRQAVPRFKDCGTVKRITPPECTKNTEKFNTPYPEAEVTFRKFHATKETMPLAKMYPKPM